MVKLPQPPPADELSFSDTDFRHLSEPVLWRVHRTSGDHVIPWNRLRYWGPSSLSRFDPHRLPPHTQGAGVSYTALDIPSALAEVFQRSRYVDSGRGHPYLTAWKPSRPLQLLDLTGDWPIRNGASYTLNTGRRDHCRAWARAIIEALPDLDGLWHHSAMTGSALVTLFTASANSFPANPVISLPLDDPGLRPWLTAACEQIGYGLL